MLSAGIEREQWHEMDYYMAQKSITQKKYEKCLKYTETGF